MDKFYVKMKTSDVFKASIVAGTGITLGVALPVVFAKFIVKVTGGLKNEVQSSKDKH